MPGLMSNPMSRQNFLRVSAACVGGLLVDRFVMAVDDTPNSKFRVTLLSDTHIDADPAFTNRKFRPQENLEKIVAEAVATDPQMVFLNGDAARLEGLAADYALLKSLLQPLADKAPIHIGMGNHDDREQFRKAFSPQQTPERRASGKHVSIVETGAVRWIMLDSLYYVNKAAGLLGKTQRNWLNNYLRTHADRPAVVLVHHVLSEDDGDLLDTPLLLQIAHAHTHVKAIFYGHSHRFEFKKDGDLQLVNLPACGYNFADNQPVGWMEAQVSATEIELKLHAIGGNRAQDGQLFKIALQPS